MAGDGNSAAHVYPDQSLYPSNSVPLLVERINNALQRADQVRAGTELPVHVLECSWPACTAPLLHLKGGLQQLVCLVPAAADTYIFGVMLR